MIHVDEWLGTIDNLEHLAETLRVASEKLDHPVTFDMSAWRKDFFGDECKTACCAIGLGIQAGTITGLKLCEDKGTPEDHTWGVLRTENPDRADDGSVAPTYEIAQYFEMSS